MGYECLVCFEKCKAPISCLRCKKLICKSHLSRLDDRCPHCRLEPFQFQEQKLIKREELKKNAVFKCLVEGCQFEGKYIPMVKHRKKMHYNQKLEEIIFPEQREVKIRRDTLKNLLMSRLSKSENKHFQKAFFIYAKTQGKCPLHSLMKIFQHLETCQDQGCKRIVLTDHMAFISGLDKQQTHCQNGRQLTINF